MVQRYPLVDGLQEFTLMVAYSGVVNLFDQLGVFVDEPGFPQHICCRVLYLKETQYVREKAEHRKIQHS